MLRTTNSEFGPGLSMKSNLPTANSTLAIGGVSSPLDSFEVVESSVLRTNFCAPKSATAMKFMPINFIEDTNCSWKLSIFKRLLINKINSGLWSLFTL